MSKLLSANFSRLVKSKIFWVLEILSALAGVFIYSLAIINTKNIGTNWFMANGNSYFFIVLIYIGIIMAVFTAFFVGTEYADGTIRNKLTVGHNRRDIYLSNLSISVITGLIFTVTHLSASALVGLPFVGSMIWNSLAPIGWRIPCAVILIICYAAIFTFFAMLDSSKARNASVSLILSLLIALAGLFTYSRLNEPQITSRMVMQEDGSFLREEVLNNKYLEGTVRQIYTAADAMIPSSQALRIANNDSDFSAISPIALVCVSAAVTVCGIAIFTKKDIK